MPERRSEPFYRILQAISVLVSPLTKNKALDQIMGWGFLIFILAIVAMGIFNPGYPYDLIPYIGASLDGNAQNVHETAWNLVKNSAPQPIYAELAQADVYRLRQSTDPTAFNSVLPLYAVKIGYIYLLKLFAPAFGWINTAFWTNYIAGIGLGLISLVWMARTKSLQGAGIVAAVLLAGNYADMISHPSPDTIAAALTLGAIYLWLRSSESIALPLLMAAFLFRPDTIIFVFALILSSVAFQIRTWRQIGIFVALVICSIFIRNAVDHPGWWTHYYFSTVTIQNTLENFTPEFSLFAWLKGQARGIWMSLTEFNWPVLLVFLSGAIIVLVQSGKRFLNRQSCMLLACFLTIGGKFLVFPLPDDRLYITFILAGTLIFLEVLKPRLNWQL